MVEWYHAVVAFTHVPLSDHLDGEAEAPSELLVPPPPRVLVVGERRPPYPLMVLFLVLALLLP